MALLLSAGCDTTLRTKDMGGIGSGKLKGGRDVSQVLWGSAKVKASRKAEIAKLLEHPCAVSLSLSLSLYVASRLHS